MQMLYVAPFSEATLVQLSFLCLALGADHPPPDTETSLPIQHLSELTVSSQGQKGAPLAIINYSPHIS